MRIQNHFRRVVEDYVLKNDRVTSEGWLFAIYAELHLDARRPNVWAIRNLFDRALDNPRYVSHYWLIAPGHLADTQLFW